MDSMEYSKWNGGSEEIPRGPWGSWEFCRPRCFFLSLAFSVAVVLWALILSVLLAKGSTERSTLLHYQGELRTNASEQQVALQLLKKELGACSSCCSTATTQLQMSQQELKETQAKLMEQQSAHKELGERVTQSLAAAARDRENIRSELFRALEAVKVQNGSCETCAPSWISFQGSCYYFSEPQATWEAAQSHCASHGAHLVIVGGLEEQDFLAQHTKGRGYWLGLRAIRQLRKVQGYQWVDGVSLTFSHWNSGEPNDSRGREDCVMMLHSGLWNDAPCSSERDGWICEKRSTC